MLVEQEQPGWEWAEQELAQQFATERTLIPNHKSESKMKFDDIYSGAGNNLKAEDLTQEVTVTMASYEIKEFEEADGYKKPKVILSFQGKEKTLILNKTNASMIKEMHGDDIDAWMGKSITIGPDRTMYSDKMVACIRVKYKAPAQQQAAPRQQAARQQEQPSSQDMPPSDFDSGDFDADVPF